MPHRGLYVIGNGFDLHHGIRSSYYEFGRYVDRTDSALHNTAEEYLFFDGNWSSFEADLAKIDVSSVLENCESSLHGYGAEDWSDAYHHDYQYEVQAIVDALSTRLKASFTSWISQVVVPEPSEYAVSLLPLDPGAKYLTFNYTNTLQRLYGIEHGSILHIHGQVGDGSDELVLGHAIAPSAIDSLNHGVDLEAQDTRVTEAKDILDRYFARTYKPSERVIKDNRAYFESLSIVERIFVVGHSLSEVDLPYFREIIKATSRSGPNWLVTYHDEPDVPRMKDALLSIGATEDKVAFSKLSDLRA